MLFYLVNHDFHLTLTTGLRKLSINNKQLTSKGCAIVCLRFTDNGSDRFSNMYPIWNSVDHKHIKPKPKIISNIVPNDRVLFLLGNIFIAVE